MNVLIVIKIAVMISIRCNAHAQPIRPYALRSKWKDPEQPISWLRDLFTKYVAATALEMRRAYVHATPLSTINWVSSLTAILEGCLR